MNGVFSLVDYPWCHTLVSVEVCRSIFTCGDSSFPHGISSPQVLGETQGADSHSGTDAIVLEHGGGEDVCANVYPCLPTVHSGEVTGGGGPLPPQ